MNDQAIKEADGLLRQGKKVPCSGTELDKAIVVALVRNIGKRGPDPADPLGREAFSAVEQALS